MKTQIFPNWCKKLGLTLFIVFSFISGFDDFIEGFNSGFNYGKDLHIANTNVFKSYFGENLLHYFSVISIIGMLIYMLSKEKIEDDYISKLRLESYQLTAIIGLIISLLLYAFSKDLKFALENFISLFMYFYLITFFIKKSLD